MGRKKGHKLNKVEGKPTVSLGEEMSVEEISREGTHTEAVENKEVVVPRLPLNRQEEMFMAWWHKPSARYVAQTCRVDLGTVVRYRRANKWDERLEAIRTGASRALDKLLEDSLVMQLHEIAVLRKRAYLEAMKGEFENARQAFQSFTELCKLERELKPGAEQGNVEDILIIARRRFIELRGKELGRIAMPLEDEIKEASKEQNALNEAKQEE
jgi:hypothetical protein